MTKPALLFYLASLVAIEVAIFVLYGRSLVSRLVLGPLDRVMHTADAVADGDLAARAAATRDFATLAERLNRMTERLLDAQSQLVRSEKLASIGRLAAGVAHDVGSPFGAIGTYLEVLRPFYTTKEPGRGTGLGLAIVARTVHDMGGVVWVDGAREGGAAFKLFFPIARPR
ncbi:MAG: ATP-binding protein [Gemmatimonadota bacterium]